MSGYDRSESLILPQKRHVSGNISDRDRTR